MGHNQSLSLPMRGSKPILCRVSLLLTYAMNHSSLLAFRNLLQVTAYRTGKDKTDSAWLCQEVTIDSQERGMYPFVFIEEYRKMGQ